MNICLDCLQKQKPWIKNDNVILTTQYKNCEECGNRKQIIYDYTKDEVSHLFSNISGEIKVCYGFIGNNVSEELDFSLRTLVADLGWDKVRDTIMFIKGQERGEPLAFRTLEEYDSYLDYRVVELGSRIVIQNRTITE